MNASDEQGRETDALRERISSLSTAVLRISASLDLDTVLRETVDSARALTGARYGVITTIDDTGQPQDFVTSGLTDAEQQQMMEWPHAMRFFEHLRDLPGPLRVPDLQAYLHSLDYTPTLVLANTLQATPMRHRGVHVGDSSSPRRKADTSSPPTTRRSWCCSPRKRPTRSPTPARTRPSSGRGPTSRPWWKPRRSAWPSSTPRRAVRCR